MPPMLQDDDSSAKHLRATRRHQRRSRQTVGAADFAKKIEPARKTLADRVLATIAKTDVEEDSYDDVYLADAAIADALLEVANRAEEFDRKNPGQDLTHRLFPTGRRTDITDENLFVQPDEADAVVKAIAGLGKDHPLAAAGATLAGAVAAARKAALAFAAALRERKLAEADEEIAQADLRKAYEANYLDARKALGKRIAERLFPRLQPRRRKPTEEPDPAK